MAVEELVGSIAERLVSLAADIIEGQLRAAWGLEGELRKLQRLLQEIQSVLADAEEKQTVDAAVRMFLNALKKVAYEAEDVLDELNYETLRHKAAEVAPGKKTLCSGKVRDFFSSHNPLFIRLKMGRKVSNLLEDIEKIADESTKFNFKYDETAAPIIEETTSLFEESQIVGRLGEKDELVKLLINNVNHNSENVAVLPIVGMGGLGKTTLAQSIYMDPRVRAYFELRAWVCVSDTWDQRNIIYQILQVATEKKFESRSMEMLHLALREALTQKRFLIVLDDVWEEEPSKWYTLKSLIDCGGKGSVVIVTTRSGRVAEITGTLPRYHPPHLSEDDSWDLFCKRAFAPGDEKPEELVEIAKAIAKKCSGLPLALKILGRLLYNEREKNQWLKIKNSDLWNIETSILPALRLSYKHLPSHSKRCFTFCALFPKDYEMDKETLINLWMAHGFIPSDGGMLEIKGEEIFNQLVQRSFLQDVKEESPVTTCRMDGLLHDLALSIAGNDYAPMQEEYYANAVMKDVYHLSSSISHEFNIKQMLKASPYLRTILFNLKPSEMMNNINMNVSSSTFLRVLTLKAQSLKLPSSMKRLQHLRYLQLCIQELSELPESICTLLNLQTLNLSGCCTLRRLPKRMCGMISLRYLYLDECDSLEEMAPDMRVMTNLQTLTLYVVGEESGRGIGELKGLHLSSRLKLRNLESVKDSEEARRVNSHWEDLNLLTLDWTTRRERRGGEINTTAEQVLEELKPPGRLKALEIIGYEGSKFPTWMADRLMPQHLILLRLELNGSVGLHRLPPLWQLSSLEELYLRGMDDLKYIVSDDDAAAAAAAVQAFPSLKQLELKHLGSLEGWWQNKNAPLPASWFPSLVRLEIFSCRELTCTMPSAPCLKSLDVRSIKKIHPGSISTLTSLVSLRIETVASRHEQEGDECSGRSSLIKDLTLSVCDWTFSSPTCYGFWTRMTSLESLSISDCDDLAALPCQVLEGLKSLARLEIEGCHNITGKLSGTTDGCLLPQLQVLRFINCLKLETVPPIGGPSLTKLSIDDCPKFASLAADEQELGRLTSLAALSIYYCPSLTSLAMGGLTALRNLTLAHCADLTSFLVPEAVLPNLEELRVVGCPRLEKECAGGGQYWNLVSNIPQREIKDEKVEEQMDISDFRSYINNFEFRDIFS